MPEVTDEIIAELKSQHKELYMASLSDTEVIFRPLTVREFERSLEVAQTISSIDSEEFVVCAAILFPEIDLDNYGIGEVTALADEILIQSGFADFDVCQAKLDEARGRAEEIVNFMKAMIIASNQQFSAVEIESMTFSQLAECAALAEKIFEIQSQVATGQQIMLEIKGASSEAEEVPLEEAQGQRRPPAISDEEWEAILRGEYANPDKASTIGAAGADDPIARKLREALG